MLLSKNDFIADSSYQPLINTFYTDLSSKYAVKLMGIPSPLLGWNTNFHPDGALHVNQAHQIDVILGNYKMK